MNTKVEELINNIDPITIQCRVCKKYNKPENFSLTGWDMCIICYRKFLKELKEIKDEK